MPGASTVSTVVIRAKSVLVVSSGTMLSAPMFSAMVLVLAVASLSGCGGGEKDIERSLTSGGGGESDTSAADEYEVRLRSMVERELESAHREQGKSSAKVSFKRPYYFREYAVYSDEVNDFELDFTERDSRIAPLTANMTVDKVRFATRFHAKKDEARADDNFLRGTGTETVSYELRNGRWHRVGSLYVANTSEEFVDGVWQPILELPSRPESEPEEPKGWWQRLMFWR